MKDQKKNRYEIIYWLNGDIKKTHVEAVSAEEARVVFYINYSWDDIIGIKDVTNDVL